ncbi:FkbM family methyltransferase [Propionivibrio sp.]|uniref:FkbM family methyltransferase n=1 Tax=Propionivibrio sp. TaxID=2212460 RepID=UPI00345B8E70
MDRYEESIRQGQIPLIVDCGGNIGMAALWFAKQFPRSKIISIEPDENNLELLQLNTQAFSDRITIIHGGIWNKHGALKIINPDSGSAAFRVEFQESQDSGSIPAYTMDDLCNLGGDKDPLIVKTRYRRCSGTAFSSNTDWVDRSTLITLELDDWLLPWQGTSRNFFPVSPSTNLITCLGRKHLLLQGRFLKHSVRLEQTFKYRYWAVLIFSRLSPELHQTAANRFGVRSQGVKRGRWKTSERVLANLGSVETAATKPACEPSLRGGLNNHATVRHWGMQKRSPIHRVWIRVPTCQPQSPRRPSRPP